MADSRGFSEGRGQGQTAPRLSFAQREGCFQRRAEAFLARKPAPGRPSLSPPASPAAAPAWASRPCRDREGPLPAKPSPARLPTSKGLGGTFRAFLQEASCSGSSPEQRRATINAQTFLSMGVRPELELTGGEAVPRSSRAARGRR